MESRRQFERVTCLFCLWRALFSDVVIFPISRRQIKGPAIAATALPLIYLPTFNRYLCVKLLLSTKTCLFNTFHDSRDFHNFHSFLQQCHSHNHTMLISLPSAISGLDISLLNSLFLLTSLTYRSLG